jgi:alkaline phosphatase D
MSGRGSRTHRRSFMIRGGLLVAAAACPTPRGIWAQAGASPQDRPQLPHGIAFGDVRGDRALVWARADRPGRLIVEWDTSERFANARRVLGPHALEDSDYTARLDLTQLPPDQHIFTRVMFQSLKNERALSEPVLGSFRSAPERRGDIRFVWTGDTAGQGFGINPDIGGMRGYAAMAAREPHFFIHSGDTIYADGPLLPEQTVEDGKVWRNLVTPEKSKVAETLDEFRGNYRYNLLDQNVRGFNAQVAQIWQWDDHETTNNWSSSKDLSSNPAYTEKNLPLLAARAKRAFLDYAPLRTHGDEERERVFRHIPYGPLLDVFVLDMRSYRGPNTANRQASPGPESVFLGRPQLQWLKTALATSSATWKVIAADMPIGLLIGDGTDADGNPRFEGIANGHGPVRGREFEIADLLRFIKRSAIKNTVWLTADVHYTAAHLYDPTRAQFSDFEPFWEFVAGPINAGVFGPGESDDTFGQRVMFSKTPPAQNYSPLSGLQFFGEVNIDARSQALTVALRDISGAALFTQTLEAQRGRG